MLQRIIQLGAGIVAELAEEFSVAGVKVVIDKALDPVERVAEDAVGLVGGVQEILTDDELYDEMVMTRLRTQDGLSLDLLQDQSRTYFLAQAQPHLHAGRMVQEGHVVRLTRKGIFTSNDIISDLMRG